MASAHGAGLMVLPLVLGAGASAPMSSHHHGSTVAGRRVDVLQAGVFSANAVELSAPLIHTIGYLAITALVAVVVYEKLGLRMLRRAWINVDLIWAAALIVAGVMTPLL
jgi:hypothetical protein